MIIDCANPNTFPKEISALAEEFVSKLPCEYNILESDLQICGFYVDETVNILNNCDILLYHATKLLHPELLLKNGLRVNEKAAYIDSLISDMRELNVSENDIKDSIKIISEYREAKYQFNNEKTAPLYFYSIYDLTKNEYDEFCENIGGETARWAIKQKMPEVYRYLKQNGEGVVVKFKTPFINIDDYKAPIIARAFLYHFISKLICNSDQCIKFDGSISNNISPEDIIDIIHIPYANEIDT